jgi:hypothetical protein
MVEADSNLRTAQPSQKRALEQALRVDCESRRKTPQLPYDLPEQLGSLKKPFRQTYHLIDIGMMLKKLRRSAVDHPENLGLRPVMLEGKVSRLSPIALSRVIRIRGDWMSLGVMEGSW